MQEKYESKRLIQGQKNVSIGEAHIMQLGCGVHTHNTVDPELEKRDKWVSGLAARGPSLQWGPGEEELQSHKNQKAMLKK